MKVLHLYRNARRFLHETPFYNYFFSHPDIQAEISDSLLPNETIPKTHIPVPLTLTHSDDDRLRLIESCQPDILHCHHVSLLESTVRLAGQKSLPLFYSLYRQSLMESNLETLLPESSAAKLDGLFVPSAAIREQIPTQVAPGKITVLSEVLSSTYSFSKGVTNSADRRTFAALISEKNEPYIHNVHRSLEKILVTNHTLNIAWVCLDESCEKSIRADLAGRKISEYVSLVPLYDFPLLAYDGLVTDGNQNRCLSDSQYFHLLMSCLSCGKLLISFPEPGMEDVLVDGTTCFVVPSQSPNKLSHLIHFLINFPDEMDALVERAREYTREHFSLDVMQKRLREAYSNAGSTSS